MAFNAKKFAEKTTVKPYEKMLKDNNDEHDIELPSEPQNYTKMLEEDRKNDPGDEIIEKRLKREDKTAQTITEDQLDKRKSYIPHRNDLGIPVADMSKKNSVKIKDDFAKENNKEDRDTKFWDDYVGDQMDEDQITRVSSNDQPSQLLSNFDSREDFRKENPSMKVASAVESLKDADAMLYHIYRTSAEQNRTISETEKNMVSDINNNKALLLAELTKLAACMEHECHECNHFWANNKKENKCPECGSSNVSNNFDEPMEDEGEDKACV